MSRLFRTRLAGVVLLVLALTGCQFDGAYDLPLPGSPVSEDDSYEVTAEFADILNIVPRSPIMVDDVTVGEVIEVERVGWHARIILRVRKDVVLPDNAIADIRQVSLLGEKYVALEPPADGASTGRLGEGDNIPLSSTGRNPEVEEVLGALSYLLSGGGVAQLGTITTELNNVMNGRQDKLKHLLGSLGDVVGTLDGQKADIIKALESLNNLTATLNAERDTIGEALDVAGPAIKVLADQHDELIAMLTALDKLGVVGTRVIGASKDNLLKSLDELRPILSRLSEAGDKLAPGLNLLVSFPFPKEASEIVKGDYANTSIRADISLENLVPGGGLAPPIDLPSVDDVLTCLTSGSLTSPACVKVLSDVDLLNQLRTDCAMAQHAQKPVCQIINQIPATVSTPSLPDVLGGILGGLPRSLSSSLASGTPSGRTSTRGLYGGTP